MKSITMSAMFAATFLLLLGSSVTAAPLQEADDEISDNSLTGRVDHTDTDMTGPWDAFDTAALRKLLLQLDAEERFGGRVGRAWPQAEPRGWGMRGVDGRIARQWRTDKRQVRFRQCYFNPISCFRK